MMEKTTKDLKDCESLKVGDCVVRQSTKSMWDLVFFRVSEISQDREDQYIIVLEDGTHLHGKAGFVCADQKKYRYYYDPQWVIDTFWRYLRNSLEYQIMPEEKILEYIECLKKIEDTFDDYGRARRLLQES